MNGLAQGDRAGESDCSSHQLPPESTTHREVWLGSSAGAKQWNFECQGFGLLFGCLGKSSEVAEL